MHSDVAHLTIFWQWFWAHKSQGMVKLISAYSCIFEFRQILSQWYYNISFWFHISESSGPYFAVRAGKFLTFPIWVVQCCSCKQGQYCCIEFYDNIDAVLGAYYSYLSCPNVFMEHNTWLDTEYSMGKMISLVDIRSYSYSPISVSLGSIFHIYINLHTYFPSLSHTWT